MSEKTELERRKISVSDIIKSAPLDTLGGLLDPAILKRAKELKLLATITEDMKNFKLPETNDRNSNAYYRLKEKYRKSKISNLNKK